MKAVLRPVFVGGLSIAIAAMTLLGSSSVALAATRPSITTWSINAPVYEGDRPTVTATFTDPDLTDQHTVDISWGDNSYDSYVLPVGDRSFAVRKTVPYLTFSLTPLTVLITLNDPIYSNSKTLAVTVLNAPPSITSFALSSAAIDMGQAVTATGTFTDPGAADTHTVTVDWGDLSATTTMNLAAGVGSFTTTPHTYSGAGDFTVTLTVADNGGATATATSMVSVRKPNQAPSIVSFTLTAGSEGGTSTLALTFTDPDPADTHTVSVAWGDGTTSSSGTLASTVTAFNASHVYADTGMYTVVLTLADSASHTVTASASVSPTNVAPVVGSLTLSPSSVVDHQTVTVSGTFTDPGTADTFTLTIDWGDTTSSSQSLVAGTRSFTATHAYNAAGSVTIVATVTDRDNGKSSSSATLVVLPSNHAPANLVVQATAALEGGSTTLSVSFTDAELTDTHTVAITWGDGLSESVALAAGATSSAPTHTYLETGTYTVSVTVTDSGNLSVAGGTTVTATNVSPSLSSLTFSPSSVTDHQTVTVSGTFKDPGTADTYTVTFAWGDGTTSSQSLVAGVRSFSGSHDYLAAGTFTVTVTVTDRDNGAGTQNGSLVVTARNTAPSGLSLSTNVTGLSATVSGTFVDPDPLDTHDVTILWGDGTTSTSTVAASATLFTATHTYLAAGTFTVTVTVTDPAGASTSATASIVAAVLASTPADVLDQMTALVNSFALSPNTERWLLRKIDDLRASLASGGNAQLCADLKILGHISAFAGRALTNDQAAAMDVLGKKLEAAAGCQGTVILFPRVQRATTVATPGAPTSTQATQVTSNVKTPKATTSKTDTEKSEKSEVEKSEKSHDESGYRKERD
jgi:PKD repeat protein